jgi:cysteine desulfuration protein SufE
LVTLAEKKRDLLDRLSYLETGQERLAYLVDRARQQPRIPPELRNEETRVQGCLSNLWFIAEARDGRCYFQTDGDSQIVKGIAGLLSEFYSGATPEDILRNDPAFLSEAGITQHLSPNRRNGLGRLWDNIRDFALSQINAAPKG